MGIFKWSVNPFTQFKTFKAELSQLTRDPVVINSMALSTCNKEGIPSSRTVMLRNVTDNHFHFFSNYSSRKSLDIAENPHVAVCMYWHSIKTQVLIRGTCKRLPEDVVKEFYGKLPRISQIVPHVSKQSQDLDDPDDYDQEMTRIIKESEGKEMVLPKNWGGFEITPTYWEFWRDFSGSDDFQVKDRTVQTERVKFEREINSGDWKMKYLYP